MRLKELFYWMGFRPGARVYGHRIQVLDLPRDGHVEYARWLAPKARDLSLTQSEIDELRTFIHEGDIAIDIGAAIGDTTLPIALACGGTGAVIAFEPNPFTFAILGANSALNPGRANIIPIPYAVTEHDGSFVFDYGDPWFANGGDHTGVSFWRHGSAFKLPVQGRRVEPLVRAKFGDRLKRLRYIKTDVEGHDLEVLRSMEGLIREFRPYVKSEVGKFASQADRAAIHRIFTTYNYTIHVPEDNRLFGPVLTENDMLTRKAFDIFAVPNQS